MTQPQPPAQDTPVPETAAVLVAAETAVATTMFAMYTAWLAEAARLVLVGFVNVAAIWTLTDEWERAVDRDLMPELVRLARLGWEDATAQLGVNLPFDPNSSVLQDELRRSRNLLVRLPDEVYRQIIQALADAVDRGLSVDEQRAVISNILDVNGSENWQARAKTVAVTEVHRFWSMGALAAAMQAALPRATKTWDSREDRRVRPAHAQADGQTVPVFQPFIVGGVPMMEPGDPTAPPELVINCRCKMRLNRGE